MSRFVQRLPLGSILLGMTALVGCFVPDYRVGALETTGSGGASTAGTTSVSSGGGAGGVGGNGGVGGGSSGADCKVISDCPGDENECAHRTCIAGKCGVESSPDGFLVGAQTVGDCQKRICDGKGAVRTAEDDADKPGDGNPCTVDLCVGGKPANLPTAKGTACGSGGQLACDGAGNCAGCTVDMECGASTPCLAFICDVGTTVCNITYVADGMGDPGNQQAGDCKKNVCNGKGGTSVQNHDGDLPDDGNACTQDICSMGTPSHAPAPAGTSCGGKFKCDGSGTCSGCTVASDCGQDNACVSFACAASVCNNIYVPKGQGDPGGQVPGDCQKNVCDGSGSPTTIPDDADKPIDGNVCTNDVCTNGVPDHPPVGAGVGCGGALKCDGAGNCTGCGENVGCPPGTACTSNVCQAKTCVSQNVSAGTSCGGNDVCDGAGNCVCSDPAACAGKCGSFKDACSAPVNCGGCGAPQTCGGGGTANVCGCAPIGSCPPAHNCGTVPDGCGGNVSCGGPCAGAGVTCGGGGKANVCGCTPEPVATTCSGKECGPVANNCGSEVVCQDTCVAPKTCGGGGAGVNGCGCTAAPVETTCSGKCGAGVLDNCGTAVDCGVDVCTAPDKCGGGGSPNVCGCTPDPDPCATKNYECGSAPNGCGVMVDCDTCPDPMICKVHFCQ